MDVEALYCGRRRFIRRVAIELDVSGNTIKADDITELRNILKFQSNKQNVS